MNGTAEKRARVVGARSYSPCRLTILFYLPRGQCWQPAPRRREGDGDALSFNDLKSKIKLSQVSKWVRGAKNTNKSFVRLSRSWRSRCRTFTSCGTCSLNSRLGSMTRSAGRALKRSCFQNHCTSLNAQRVLGAARVKAQRPEITRASVFRVVHQISSPFHPCHRPALPASGTPFWAARPPSPRW
jgi:hypothetical protein